MIKIIRDKIRSFFPSKKVEQKNDPAVSIREAGTGISARISDCYGYGSGNKFPLGMSRSGISADIQNHLKIRQLARNAMYDSIEGRSLVESIVDTVTDIGLRLKPTPNAKMLGIKSEDAEAWAENVADLFHMWAKSKKSHRPRISNFYQNQRLYQLFQQRDNDIFVRLYYGRDKDQLNPLQIEFIEPNQIYGTGYTSTYANVFTDDGIIRDKNGRETGYKIWNYNPVTAEWSNQIIPAKGEKSGRTFMLHGFCPEYAGQGRGYSRLAHILQELENMTDFKQSTLKKAIAQATLTMAVENDQQDASNPVEGRVAGPRTEYGISPSANEDDGSIEKEASPTPNYTSLPEATFTEPGSVGVFNLRRGDRLKYLQDTSPGASFDNFCNSMFTSIAASVGTSIEIVQKKFSNNYSASRGTLILCWRHAMIWRNEMASDFLDPIYEMWLAEEIAAGRIQAPGFSDPRLRTTWLNCEWAGSPMPNIDPLKTAQSDEKYVELGAQTLDDVARNYNGSSGRANRVKNARQYEELPTPPWPRAPVQQTKGDSQE